MQYDYHVKCEHCKKVINPIMQPTVRYRRLYNDPVSHYHVECFIRVFSGEKHDA